MIRKRWLVGVIVVVVVAVLTLRSVWIPGDPLFRGRPVSVWVAEIGERDEQEVERWRSYGDKGVRALMVGLRQANRPGYALYLKTWRSMMRHAPMIAKRLPNPGDDTTVGDRMRILSLLGRLQTPEAVGAISLVTHSLSDRSDSVHSSAANFLWSVAENPELFALASDRQKRRAMRGLCEVALGDGNWGARNNAVGALQFFTYDKERLVPTLWPCLQDQEVQVRIMAAESLFRLASDPSVSQKLVPVAIEILQEPDDQIAHRGAELLGAMAVSPDLSIPALVDGLRSEESLVASVSAGALSAFTNRADSLVPVLLESAAREDSQISRLWLTNALERLDPKRAYGW